ncbi:hypothetical protein ACH42_14090 [Endozoicomonas sp. (ex Bugula neritina AB1)]|nr:hypothetical protein ACH42_14090 [Endozoicomonas sp. (ex Bugula neritina AB1)]
MITPIRRLLIANRGEIACRIIRTAKAMGIETIALYSDADYQSLHLQSADIIVNIGPAPASESYLDINKIITAATENQADAIHPGYGFLSENTHLAEACQTHNIIFVGPDAHAIHAMGSKSQAKKLMSEANVPLVPGYHGQDQSDDTLINEAKRIGFPMLIKAVYGGGGKGMRVVETEEFLTEGLSSARRESLNAFGDDALLLERFITTARHVEVQIFFDHDGEGVYLFDRDCSLQRRHQKVIEEAPAPGLSDSLRKRMGEAAVAAGTAINYRGAGTVEFLLEGEDFYFMEMNTRLQVEHPVTEMVTGIDLVQWQLMVAAGEPLPLTQQQLGCQGHAVEARIYAEDPYNDFLPASGRVLALSWPDAQNHLRIDSGIKQGDTITSHYDPMVAKMIAYGQSRQEAIEQLTTGLQHYHQAGVTDNRDFLLHLLKQPAFAAATLNTHFVEQHSFTGLTPLKQRQLLVAATLYQQHTNRCRNPLQENLPASVVTLYLDNKAVRISVCQQADNFKLEFPDGSCLASAQWYQEAMGYSGVVSIQKNSALCRVIPLPGQRLKVILPDCSYELGLPGCNSGNSHSDSDLTAPMNGTVTKVFVTEGEAVDEGASLMIVEAMKMEHCIKASETGIIDSILFQPGDRVEAGTTLLTFTDESYEANP